MATTLDPYAAIRSLASSAILHDAGDATPFYYEHGDGGSNSYFAPTRAENWALNGDAIGGFQSKYNNFARNDDGTFTAQFQNPGRDKYQLLEANYTVGPDGSYQMVGDPREIEQESSMSSAVKGIGTGAAFLAGGAYLLGPAGFGAAGAGAAGSGAAGAVSGATAAELSALNGGMMGAGSAAGGAAAGGAGLLSAADPLAGYMTTGAVEGSTLGNALTGAGGAAGAVGSGTVAGALGSLPGWAIDAGKYLGSNPRLLGGLLGGLTGALGGDDSGPAPYTGPMPTITRGQWKPTNSAQMMQSPNYGLLQPQGTRQPNSGMGRYMGLLGG